MEKQVNKILAFLDVCIDNNDPSCIKASMYHKKTVTGLLTNFFSFTSFRYKVGLIRTLVDRAYKKNSSLPSFNKDVEKLTHIFKKNQFSEHLITKEVSTYLDKKTLLHYLITMTHSILGCHIFSFPILLNESSVH